MRKLELRLSVVDPIGIRKRKAVVFLVVVKEVCVFSVKLLAKLDLKRRGKPEVSFVSYRDLNTSEPIL